MHPKALGGSMELVQMIRGKEVYPRTVRQSDLGFCYEHVCDVEGYGPCYPISVPSESDFI